MCEFEFSLIYTISVEVRRLTSVNHSSDLAGKGSFQDTRVWLFHLIYRHSVLFTHLPVNEIKIVHEFSFIYFTGYFWNCYHLIPVYNTYVLITICGVFPDIINV